MKKMICILLALVIIAMSPLYVHAAEQDNGQRLSEVSDEEIKSFLSEYGIAFPGVESNYEYWRDFVLMVITKVEQDPDYEFRISYTDAYAFANEIKAAVNDYYGLGSLYGISAVDTVTLVNSVRYIDWSSSYSNYNCYAFAIGRYSGLNPGDIGPGSLGSLDVDDVADLVIGDLEALNNQCVKVYTYLPSSRPSGSTVICLRTGPIDYHFMKLSGGSWYHKPGRTLPLRWRHTSPGAVVWTNEAIIYEDGQYVYYEADTYYNSGIRYFVYKTDHSCTTTYGGEDYHSGEQHYYKIINTCTHCGDIYYTWDIRDCDGPPCLGYMSLPIGEVELETE